MFDVDFALRLLGMRLKDRAFIGPETVQIDLTDDCTNNCLGCWARSPFLRADDHYDTLEKGTLDTGFVLDLLLELAAIGVRTVFLGGGGDPLCHPDFPKIVARIKELGMACSVNTNLMMADAGLMQSLVDVGLDELIVSLWAADAQMYSRLHPNQSEGTFLHLENMLRYANHIKGGPDRKKPRVKIYHVICSINYEQIPEMIEHGRAMGVEEVEFSIFDPIPRRTHIFLLTKKQIEWITRFFNEYEQKEPPFVHFELFLRRLHNIDVLKGVYDNGIVESIPCAAGWFYARITTVGQVHSCLKAHRIAAGNLKEHKFGQIWYGEGQSRFRANTVKLRYDNPFLANIGHDIDFALPGCYRICDNLGCNQQIMRLEGGLTANERECLSAMELAVREGAGLGRLRAIHGDFESRERRIAPLVDARHTTIDVPADHPFLLEFIGAPMNLDELGERLCSIKRERGIRIPVTMANLARLPKILTLIRESARRDLNPEDGIFSFAPVADGHRRVGPFLKNLREKLNPAGVLIQADLSAIEATLRSAAQGLDRFSEADLLRALGVIANEQLIGPRTFHLDVANGCNTDCIYCWFHSPLASGRPDAEKFDTAWRKELMPWEMFERLVDDLAALGCKEDIVLSGKGEPLVHPRIADMVRHLKKRGLFATLFTNGLLLEDAIAQTCIESGLDLLYVSLSAATAGTFAKLQQKPKEGGFEKVTANVRSLIEKRNQAGSKLPRVVMVDVLCNLNCNEVEAFARLSAGLGADLLRYQLAAIEPYNRSLKLSDEQLAALPDALEKAKGIARASGMEVIANIDAQMDGGDSDWSGEKYLATGCLAGWTFARAWADGTLSFCCSPKPIGSLKEKSFARWWQGAAWDTYRLGGKQIAVHRELPFADGTPLWTDICRRCPNYEGIGRLEEIIDDLGLTEIRKF